MPKITHEEFRKALEIVERFKCQEKKTIQVTVEYNATVSATVQVPDDWTDTQIKEELETGYYGFDYDDEPRTKLKDITRLIINGYDKL
jgi:hypothetical protein